MDLKKDYYLVPFLLEQYSLTFQKKWLAEKNNWSKIINQLDLASETEETKQKKKDLMQKMKLVEEVLAK